MSMQIIRRIGYMLVVCAIGLNFVSAQTAAADNRADRVEGDGSRLIADSIMKQYPDLWRMENRDRAKWSYVYGLTGTAYLRLHARTQDPRYLNYAKSYADLFVKSDGSIRQYQMKEYNIDHVAVGPLLLGLYKATGEKRYSIASKTLIQQLATHPRTQNGGYWHKKKYPHQIWLDGLFMWMPFASEFSETFKQPHYVDDIVKQQMLVKSKHRDPKTGLYYHGWDESRKQSWSDPETGLSKHFWGRANGWLAMALIESLDYFPKDHPDRQQIIGMARELAVALVQVQDSETGLWYQVLDQGTRKGNYLEGSCTSMFAYFLLKGARMGYLDEVYREKGIEAYEGLWNHLIKQKNEKLILTQVCAVAGLGFGRDGSYEYYINEKRRDNDPKAIGPLILAALEYESLFDHGSAAWEPGQPIPEKIAPIDAPFEMPQLQRPVFKKVDYNILDYGAQKCAWNAAERVLSTDAIRKAIETCNKNGGGRVVIPKGDWITGAVHLKSNVNFHLEEGATLHFSDNPEDYLPAVHVRWEGVECYNYSPLVYAPNCENVAITGKGTLNGHGKKWWALKKKEDFDRIKASAQPLESRQFGLKGGVTSQRPVLLMPWKSKNVLIEGVTLIDPPFWTVQPVYCENVIIRGITIDSRRGHNGDGIDLDSCKNVLIEYNNLQTNDDAVCLKSGLNQDGIQIGIPCENVVVRHFVARNVLTGSGGIVIGSEMSGGVRNVYVHDALFEDCDRGIRMKSTRGRGGIVENIFVEDVTMKNIRQEAFVINTSYAGATQGPAPLFRNIRLKNIRASNVARCIEVKGLADMKVQNIELSDCSFTGRQGATISHAEGVTFNNVTIHSKQKALSLRDSSDCRFTDLDLDGMKPDISDCDNVNVRFASKTEQNQKKSSRSDVYDGTISGKEILTPKPGPEPKLTGASIFGVRPGKPIRYCATAIGDQPITFSATGLPAGVSIDPKTGWITGRAPQKKGDVSIIVKAVNTKGSDVRQLTLRVGDTICLAPPMGWNSWYVHSEGVSEAAIREMATAMKEKGLQNCGWNFVNIDDCWMGERDPQSKRIQPNAKFDDMKKMVDYVNSLGLKVGIYSTTWMSTFAGYIGGTGPNEAGDYSQYYLPENERQNPFQVFGRFPRGIEKRICEVGPVWFVDRDAQQFADWGIDYVKYDWMEWDLLTDEEKADGVKPVRHTREKRAEHGITQRFYNDFRALDRDVVISLSPNHQASEDAFVRDHSNLWRLTEDIHAHWQRMIAPFEDELVERLALTRPGAYGDLDMLQIGPMGKPNRAEKVFHPSRLKPAEQYHQVTLWCLLTQPLLLSCNIPTMDAFDLNLVTNHEVLAINQDALCQQGYRVKNQKGDFEIWAKNLADGGKAVGLFNLSGHDQVLEVTAQELGIQGTIRDLWRQKDIGVLEDTFSANVSSHGVVFIKISDADYSFGKHTIAPIKAPFEMPQLKRPVFQKKRFRIDAYGGVAGGKIKNTEAIKKAIDACHRAGGGTVVVPQGKWLTGPVHLKSNVQLEVVEGAELIFADQITDYLPAVESAWEGLDCYNYSSLIYAVDCENIGLIGKGRLTCIRDGWKAWDNRPKSHMETLKTLYYQAAEGVPTKERQVANSEARMRPPFIQFLRCKNVLIEGLTIRNSPFWTIHPLKCENVIARDLDIKAHGHNTDGIDPDQTKNMLIEYCTFDQGDDAIVIKAGRNHDGWRGQPSENIVIRHCTIRRGHRFLAMGSEMSGGIRNIYMHDCKLESKGGSVRSLLYLKTNHRRGGFMENIYVKDVTCDKVSSGVLEIETNVLYQWRTLVETVDRKLTTIRNISLENITVGEAQYGIRIKAEKEMPVRNVTLTNVKVGKVLKAPRVLSHVENLKEDRVVFGRNGE